LVEEFQLGELKQIVQTRC